jgi:hypothetical protein
MYSVPSLGQESVVTTIEALCREVMVRLQALLEP